MLTSKKCWLMSSHSRSRNSIIKVLVSHVRRDCEVEHLSYWHSLLKVQSYIQVFISVCMESSISSNTLSGSGAKYLYGTVEHKQHMSVSIFPSTSYSQSQALPKKRHLCASSAVKKVCGHIYDRKNTHRSFVHSAAACQKNTNIHKFKTVVLL